MKNLPSSGLFVPLYDSETINLYLAKGIYGVLTAPVLGEVKGVSKHYAALADFACAREGTHIFFFNERKVVYGGQTTGSPKYGSYHLNGPYSPMGRVAKSSVVWDESNRKIYEATDKPGIFRVTIGDNKEERCQPYLIRFVDKLDLKGKSITSDDLYVELSASYHYPLPSNSIQSMSFCTLTPFETDILISLLQKGSENFFKEPIDKIDFKGKPVLFNPSLGIQKLSQASSKYHFEASVISNPDLLPNELRPENATICRNIPITPFKPSQMDRADICYYTDPKIQNGTIPNKVLELEWKKAGEDNILKIVRYIKWLNRVIPKESSDIIFYLFAPEFKNNINKFIPRDFSSQIKLIKWDN